MTYNKAYEFAIAIIEALRKTNPTYRDFVEFGATPTGFTFKITRDKRRLK